MRAFAIAGACIWNGLPVDVTSALSLPVFRQRLKTVLFHRSYQNICHLNFHLSSDSGPSGIFNTWATLDNFTDDDEL